MEQIDNSGENTDVNLETTAKWRIKEMMEFWRHSLVQKIRRSELKKISEKDQILQDWYAFMIADFWPKLEQECIVPLEIIFSEIHQALKKHPANIQYETFEQWLQNLQTYQTNAYALIEEYETQIAETFGVLAISVLHDMRHAIGNLTAQLQGALETITMNNEIDKNAIPLLRNIVVKHGTPTKSWKAFLDSRQLRKETYISQYEVLHLEQKRPVTLETLCKHLQKRTNISKKHFDALQKKPNVRISIEQLDNEPTPTKIVRQPILLTEVINELVVNAIKVLKLGTNDGKIEVHTSRTATDLCITVQDNGPGFTTTDTTTTKSLGGTGQGLAKIQEDITILGGTLKMHSSANGALCTVTIPLHTED
jgi:signal transduction histidine kinase